jgi:LuxR family maltose regulon positive regulatory protein
MPSCAVERSRLVESLDHIRPGGVGLISAPAGSGKSVLMAQWMRLDASARCQVRITSAHNDPVVFARALAVSIGSVAPHFDVRIASLVAGGGVGLGVEFLGRLLVDLEELAHPVDILFDDVQFLSDPALCRDVEALLACLPDNVRVVLGSRWDPLIRLNALRLDGRLVEVRASDLAFDASESRALIEAVSQRPISDAHLEALLRRTEGWAAGLQLAAISLARTPDAGQFVSAFTGSNRLVADYLGQEVIDDLEPDIRRFLLCTSVLEWLSPELCDALTGDDNAYEILGVLMSRSLFLVPDGRGERLRYHHLFAELLRYRLRASDHTREEQLRRAAADWLLSHGHVADAIEQLLAVGDARRVVDVIVEFGQEFFEREEAATVERWLVAADAMDPEPPVVLQVNLLAAQNAAHDTGAATETYRRLRRRPTVEPGEAAAAAALYAGLGLDDLRSTEVRRAASEAIDLLAMFPDAPVTDFLGIGGRDTVEAIAHAMMAVAALHDGNLAESADLFGAVLDLPGAKYRVWRSYALGGLALTRGLAGHCAEAQSIATATIDDAEANHVASHYCLTYAHFALALVAMDRDDLAMANHHLHESGLRVQRTRRKAFAAFQRLLYIEQVAATSGPGVALAERDLPRLAVLEPALVVDLADAQQLRLLVAQGELARARAVLARLGRPAALTAQMIDLELAAGRVEVARDVLDRWTTLPTDPRTAVERSLRTATVLQAEGRRLAASAALQHALDVAEPEGLRRPFLEQPAVTGLLQSEARRASRPFARSVLTALSVRKKRASAGQLLPEELTDREREVLNYLPTRLSNTEVAAELYISVNTLKSHLRHIYVKLDVPDRDAAVARASSLGLL